MKWMEAKNKIELSIIEGTDLNTLRSNYRYVIDTNSRINSKRYKYFNEKGFKVSIGKKSAISIPWSVLEECFIQSKLSGDYDGTLFRRLFPLQSKDHPCHVHVIGKIFDVAEVAIFDGKKYKIREGREL